MNANIQENGRHSDDEAGPTPEGEEPPPEVTTPEALPVVPPRRRDHRKQTPPVSSDHVKMVGISLFISLMILNGKAEGKCY